MTTMVGSQPKVASTSPRELLWQQAFARVEPHVQATLVDAKTSKRDVVAALMKTVEEKRTWSIRRQWKFKTPNGRVIILRDVLEKIAKWLDRFKGAVDAAVQYDPVHAALPWAAIRFLLQAAIDDIQTRGSIITALESFTRIMSRCARVEELHMRKKYAMSKDLEDALIRLYTDILSSLSAALNYFHKSHGARLFGSVIEPAVLISLDEQEQEVLKLISIMHSEVLQELDIRVQRIMDVSTMMQTSMSQQQTADFLKWLSSTRVYDHHKSVSSRKIPGSGNWVTQHTTYRTWLEDSSSSILLLQGIRGCGKTVLMSTIIDSLEKSTASSKTLDVPCAFFYCAKLMSEPDRASPETILRSIIRQLSVTTVDSTTCTVDDKVWEVYSQRLQASQPDKIDLQTLDSEECLSLLVDLTWTNPAYLIIDAVDELAEQSRAVLLGLLQRLVSESGSLVKIVVSSRDNAHVEALLPVELFGIRISAEMTSSDMTAFIHHQVNEAVASARLLNGSVGSEMKTRLIQTLMNGAGEMFQWVILQINFLSTRTSEQDILTAMEAGLFATLDELYTEAFNAILTTGSFSRDMALQVFSWLLYGKSTLTAEALRSALVMGRTTTEAQEIRDMDLMRICQNLIIYDSHLNVFRFCHSSVPDFLRHQPELASNMSNKALADACIHQCIEGEADAPFPQRDIPLVEFYTYAALHWWEHIRGSESDKTAENLTMLEFVFDQNPPEISLAFHLWLNWMRDFTESLPIHDTQRRLFGALWSTECQPMFTACQFGLNSLLQKYLDADDQITIDVTNAVGHTGFYLASAGGYTDLVCMLYQHKANANIRCGWLGSPIQAACFHGHMETVRLLLELGVSSRSSAKFTNALEAACRGNKPEVAQLLLENGSVLEGDDDYQLALRWSSEAGLETVVDWLLRSSTRKSVGAATNQAVEMANAAIKRGSVRNLQKLLHINSDKTSIIPPDAIATASYHGHTEMARFLRELGCSLEAEGPYGSALRSACLSGHEAVVRMLLGWGIDVNSSCQKGHAIQAAAMKGHSRLILLLIAEGADVDMGRKYDGEQDPLGTPLEVACYYGHRAVVEILLKADAYYGYGGYFKDAMHAAIEGNQSEIALLLLGAGYDVGRSPHEVECMAMMPLLPLEQEAAIAIRQKQRKEASGYNADCYEHRGGGYRYMLELCAARGNTRVMEAAMERLDSDHNVWQTVELSLKSAASNGQLAMVRALATTLSCDLHSAPGTSRELWQNSWYSLTISLIAAASQGHLQTLEYLTNRLSCMAQHGKCAECGFATDERNPDEGRVRDAFEGAIEKAFENGHSQVLRSLWAHVILWGHQYFHVEQLVQVAVAFADETALKTFLDQALGALSTQQFHDTLNNAMMIAGYEDRLSIAQLILGLAKGSNGLDAGETAYAGFICACRSGSNAVATAWLQSDTEFQLHSQQQLEGLIEAAIARRETTLEKLIDGMAWASFADLDFGLVQDAFVAAAANGYVGPARRIFEHTLAKNKDEMRSDMLNMGLVAACFQVNSKGVDFCIQEGAHVNGTVPVPRDVHQRYADFMDFDDDTSEPFEDVINRYMKSRAVSSDAHVSLDSRLYATQAVLGRLYKQTKIWGYKEFDLSNTFLKTFNRKIKSPFLDPNSRIYTLICGPLGEKIPAVKTQREKLTSVMLLLMERGVQLEPVQNQLPVRDVLALLLTEIPYTARTRKKPFWHVSTDGDDNERTAKIAMATLNSGVRGLLFRLFDRLPELQAQSTAFAMWLYVAATAGDETTLDLLIHKGVDVNRITCVGTALGAAVEQGHLSVMKKLLQAGAKVTYDEESFLVIISKGHTDAFSLLLDNGLEADWPEPQPEHRRCLVCEALNEGRMQIMQRLIDTTRQGHDHTPAFIQACHQNRVEMVEHLLVTKANVNVNGVHEVELHRCERRLASPLIAACRGSNLGMVQLLLSHGADVAVTAENEVHYDHLWAGTLLASSPLIEAADLGNVEMVRILTNSGADPNQVVQDPKKKYSHSALSRACLKGHVAVITELLHNGAIIADPPRIPNAMAAAVAGSTEVEILEILIEEYCRRGVVNEDTWREPMEIAERKRKPEVVSLFLEYFSDN